MCRVFTSRARRTAALVWLFLLHLLQFLLHFFVACRLFVTLRHRTVSKRHRPLMGACTGFECEKGGVEGTCLSCSLMSINGRQYMHTLISCLQRSSCQMCPLPLPTFLLQSLNLFTAPPSLPSLLGAAPSLSTSTFSQSRQQLDLCVRLVFSPRQPLVFPSTTTTHIHTHIHTEKGKVSHTNRKARQTNSITHTHRSAKSVSHTDTH